MNPFSLSGKRILVTGASSGIGRQIAITCAHMGATVVITGRDQARLADTLQALGDGHNSIRADMLVPEERNAIADCGPLNGVVHSAGATALSPIRMATEKHLQAIYALDYEAPLLLTQRLLAKRVIQNDGSILFIASLAAYVGVAGVGAYSGMKAAIISTARCLALEVIKQRIRVNCLAPSFVKGPLLDGVNSSISDSVAAYEARHPLGFGTADDVANAAVYFLSEASRWITGCVHVMDGGYTIN